MNEKKFSKVLILLSVLAFVISEIVMMPIEGSVGAVAVIIASIVSRNKYRIKIPVMISVFTIFISTVALIMQCIFSIEYGSAIDDYWFLEMLYGPSIVN